MKYLITGVSGFVGKHFLTYLESLNIPIVILGIDRETDGINTNEFHNIDCHFKKVDLLENQHLESILDEFRPDFIVHLASFSSVAFSWVNPIESFSNNTNVFLNLLEAIRKIKLNCRILSVGSSEEYGNCTSNKFPLTEDLQLNPLSPYAVARVSQELLSKVYVDGYGCNIVMTRSFNHFGPGQLDKFVISSFAKQLIKIKNKSMKPVLITGDTTIVRDFVDVRDVVRAYDELLKHGRSGQVYNICTGNGVTLQQIIDKMVEILGISIIQKVNPELVRPNDNKVIIGSPKKINYEIQWKPKISLDESLFDIISDWKNRIKL